MIVIYIYYFLFFIFFLIFVFIFILFIYFFFKKNTLLNLKAFEKLNYSYNRKDVPY